MNWISGGFCGGVTPGSMPNPAVKPSSADGTAEAIRGRVGRCRKSLQTKHEGVPQKECPRVLFPCPEDPGEEEMRISRMNQSPDERVEP